MSIPESSARVNPEELAVVLDRLRTIDSPALDLASAPEPLRGGFWAEIWTLTLRDHGPGLPDRVVLRLAPDPELAAPETIVQRGVADQNYPTPRIIAFGDASSTTRFWSVMDHAVGEPLLAGLSGLHALTRLPKLARTLPTQLATVAARLHALDPTPIEHALGEMHAQRVGVGALLEYYSEVSRTCGDSALMHAVDDLRAGAPTPARLVVCHGDLHPFNVLQHDGVLTVLDWTASRIADPAYDVAFTALLIANPPLDTPTAIQPVIRRAARALSRRFIRAYDAAAEQPVAQNQLAWYTQLHTMRILVDLAAWRAAGSLEDHRGHPWLSMEPALRGSLAAAQ